MLEYIIIIVISLSVGGALSVLPLDKKVDND